MSDFEDEIRRRADEMRAARQEEMDRWIEARRTARTEAEIFQQLLTETFRTSLARFELNEIDVEDEYDLQEDDEISLVLAENDYCFGKIAIQANSVSFSSSDWRHQELKSITASNWAEFITGFRPVLIEYLAAVQAEDDE